MPTANGVTFDASTYERLIELYDTDGTTLVTTLSKISTATDVVTNAEFDLLRQGGCGSGSFTLDMVFGDANTPEVGQWIVCSYSSGSKWYRGRIEEVTEASPAGVTVRTYGTWAVLTETQVGGQAWWDTETPKTFGRYDYFENDPDHASQTYTTISTLEDMVTKLYDDYIVTWGGGSVITLDSIDADDTTASFASMTFRGGESLSQIMRTLAEPYNSSYGIDADNKFYFIPNNTTALYSYRDGTSCNITSSTDRSVMFNRLVLFGGYVYGTGSNPNFYLWQFHAEDATSISTYGIAKTLSVRVPWIRNHVDSQNFADGFFAKYANPVKKYSIETIAQGAAFTPWDGGVTIINSAGTNLAADQAVDTVHVVFNEAPRFTFTTGYDEPKYPDAGTSPTTGEQSSGGGGGGGDAQNVSGWNSFVNSLGSIDSCQWAPCEPAQIGFYVTSAFPGSGYVKGDVYYMTRPICPRTNLTFFDMDNPFGQYVALDGLAASDVVGRMGTAVYMRRYADHDIDGCKWIMTGLSCP